MAVTTTKVCGLSNATVGLTSYQAVYADALLAEYRDQLETLRQQLDAKDQQIASLHAIVQTLAEQQSAKYDLRGAQFAGGFAETVQGNQQGGQLNPHIN